MRFEEFKKQTEAIYREYFKESKITTKFVKMLGNNIFIDGMLEASESDCINGYKENDIIHFSFMIPLPNNFNVETDELKSINVYSADISYNHLKPINNTWLYCEHKNIKFIKKNYTIDNFIKAYRNAVKKIYDNMYQDALAVAFLDDPSFDVRANKLSDSPQKRVIKKLHIEM